MKKAVFLKLLPIEIFLKEEEKPEKLLGELLISEEDREYDLCFMVYKLKFEPKATNVHVKIGNSIYTDTFQTRAGLLTSCIERYAKEYRHNQLYMTEEEVKELSQYISIVPAVKYLIKSAKMYELSNEA